MMFKCGLCVRTRFGKKHHLQYNALNEQGIPELYVMNICHKCSSELQKHGQKHDKAEDIQPNDKE